MKTLLALALVLLFTSFPARAEQVFRVEIGKDYKSYSQREMQRRIWELERAVWQLQQRVFDLENKRPEQLDGWVCRISAMGNTYIGTGASKAVAKANVFRSCKVARDGDGFFCREADCEQ